MFARVIIIINNNFITSNMSFVLHVVYKKLIVWM